MLTYNKVLILMQFDWTRSFCLIVCVSLARGWEITKFYKKSFSRHLKKFSHFLQVAGKTSYLLILFSLHCLRNLEFTKKKKVPEEYVSVGSTTYRTWVFLFMLNIHVKFYFFHAKEFLYFYIAFRKNGPVHACSHACIHPFYSNLFQSNKIRFGRRWLAIKKQTKMFYRVHKLFIGSKNMK